MIVTCLQQVTVINCYPAMRLFAASPPAIQIQTPASVSVKGTLSWDLLQLKMT